MIDRHFEHQRRPAESSPRRRDALGDRALTDPIALPGGEVGVGDVDVRQYRLVTGASFDRGFDLAQHHVERPAVEDDVVRHEEEQMLVVCDLQQAGAPQRTGRQVERFARCSLRDRARGLSTLVDTFASHQLRQQHHVARRSDDLSRCAVHVAYRRPQNLVSRDHARERRREHHVIERTREPERRRQVEDRRFRRRGVDEPDAFLRQAEWS